MITEDYVSFETAKLLKEKGFDVNTFTKYADKEGATEKWYDDYRERMVRFKWDCGTFITPPTEPHDKYEVYGDTISAPTLQMAMKWLREVHNLHCSIDYDYVLGWYCQITSLKETIEYDYEEMKHYHPDKNNGFSSSEEACETAIKYCLENLV